MPSAPRADSSGWAGSPQQPPLAGPGALSPAGDCEWASGDFERVQALIHERAGISLHDGKHAMVYNRLSRRLRETGHRSFREYLIWLERHQGAEWQEFVNALTTNLTSFFREPYHFEIFARHLKTRADGAPWRVWCSAASTGQEPYSIVMTALEALGPLAAFSLVASDIDSRALASAAQGVYLLEEVKEFAPERIRQHFMRGQGANQGLVRIKDQLQQPITFMNVNLIGDDWPFVEPFDVVFCRNVMIYFDAATQRRVLDKIHRFLKPQGLLFVGHAESLGESRDLFMLRGRTVYERR